MQHTRARIVAAARALLPASTTLSVDVIAAEAGVSVQTLYTHFGSKRGLLLAVIDGLQSDVGAYADFDAVWSSRDGETALRRMLGATIGLWDRGWQLIAVIERMRRTDEEIGRYLREVDGYRRSNLRSITDRLAAEGRLRQPLDAGAAADLAFALSLPAVYEELVVVRGWTPEFATAVAVESAVDAIIDPSTVTVVDPPADWSSALRPDAVDLGRAGPGPAGGAP